MLKRLDHSDFWPNWACWVKIVERKAQSASQQASSVYAAGSRGCLEERFTSWLITGPVGDSTAHLSILLFAPLLGFAVPVAKCWSPCPRDSGLRGQVRGCSLVTGNEGVDMQVELPFLGSEKATTCCQLYPYPEPNHKSTF